MKKHHIITTAIVAAGLVLTFAAFTLAGRLLVGMSSSLKDAYDGKFLVGVAINRSQIYQRNEEEYRMITSQFNAVTAENDMKWMNIHPKKDEYNFEHADKFVALAKNNSMFVTGHALVWHNQLAPWVFKGDDGGETF